MKKQVRFLLLMAALLVPWVTQAQLPTSINCSFENASDASGWVLENGSATNQWVIGSATANGGSNSLYISNNGGQSNTYESVNCYVYAYKEVSLAAGTYVASYDWRCQGEGSYDHMQVYLAPASATITAGSTPTTTDWINLTNSSNGRLDGQSTWQNVYYEFLVETAGNYKMVFYWKDDSSVENDPPAAVDNIVLMQPTCVPPTNLAASTITDQSFTLSWTETDSSTQWIVRLDDGINTPSQQIVSTPSFTFSNLSANTNYMIRVASYCGVGDTSVWRSINVRTACLPVDTLPYTYGFEDATGSGRSHSINSCWSKATNSTTAYPYPYSSYTHSGSYSLYLYSNATSYSYAVMPLFEDSLNTLQVSFYLYKTGANYGHLKVGVMTNPNDLSTFTAIADVQPEANRTWEYFVVPFGSYEGSGQYIAFVCNEAANNYVYLDDVTVEPLPSCPPIVDLQANTTVANALVTWDYMRNVVEGVPVSYTVEYAPTSDLTNIISTTTTEPSILLSGLTADTEYRIWVSADCGEDGMGVTDSITFTTRHRECLAGLTTTIVGDGTSTQFNYPFYSYYNYSYEQILYSATEMNGAQAIERIAMQRPSGAPNNLSTLTDLTIYMSHTTQSTLENGFEPASSLQLVKTGISNINIDQTTGWVEFVLDTPFAYNGIDNLVVTVNSGRSKYVNNDPATEFYYTEVPGSLREVHQDGSAYDPATVSNGTLISYRLNMRFISGECTAYATCAAPAVVLESTTDRTATISWIPGDQETEWNVSYRIKGDTVWTDAATNTTATTITVGGLMPATDYVFAVMGICEDSLTNILTVTTACGPIYDFMLPYQQDFANNGAGSRILPRCWSRAEGCNAYYPYVYTTTIGEVSNPLYFYNYNGNNTNFVALPEVESSVTELGINFDLYKNNANSSAMLIVGVMNDPADASTFTGIDTVQVDTVDVWTPFRVTFENYAGTGKHIALLVDESCMDSNNYARVYLSNLSIATVCNDTVDATVCYGSDYTENGFNIENVIENGVYTRDYFGENGCRGIMTLNLTVPPVYNVTVADETCEGSNYLLEGCDTCVIENVLQSDVYMFPLKSVYGCDSIVTLELTMLPNATTTLYDVVNYGEDYNNHGFSLTNVQDRGIYTNTFNAANGCDSIVTLNLAVNRNTVLFDLVCYGSDYTKNGFFIENVTQNLSDTLALRTVDSLADSIVVLHLLTKPTYTTALSATICQGEDFSDYGYGLTDVQVSDVYPLVLTARNNCDSTLLLDLTVNPVYNIAIYDTVCQGENYDSLGFQVLDAQMSDTLMQGLQTVNGCDSIVTLYLTVNPVYDVVLADAICQGGDYNLYDFEVLDAQVSDTLVQNLKSKAGCDSIVTLTLTVNPVYAIEFVDTLCQGDDYTEHGFALDSVLQSGVFTQNLQSLNYCDSIITLTLTVNPVKRTTLYDMVLQGQDYNKDGFEFTNVQKSGSYELVHETYLGCDSIVTLNLMMIPVYDTVIEASLCQGGDYTENNFTVLNAQTDTVLVQHLYTVNGTDSTVTLALTVNPVYDIVFYDTVCAGEDYINEEWGFEVPNPQAADTITTYTMAHFSGASINGCDSTVTLMLTVKPMVAHAVLVELCQGSDYMVEPFELTDVQESLLDTIRVRNENTCDDYMLDLTVYPVYDTVLRDTLCQGSNYALNGFNVVDIQQDLELTQTFETVNGCDSVVTLALTMNPSYEIVLHDTICQGENYNEHGFNVTNVQQSVVLSQNHTTENGCDSIVLLHLHVNTPYTVAVNETLCQGEDYFGYGFEVLDVQESQVLTRTDGCSNTTTVALTVNPAYNVTYNDTVCQGANYSAHGFNLTDVQESGVHTLNFVTETGCDSTITLNLTVNPVYEMLVLDTICQGEDYMLHGFELTDVMSSNIHTLNLETVNGCDSIITLLLTVNPVYNVVINDAVCQGSDYNRHGCGIVNAQVSNVYTRELTTVNGCDSIITLNLTVNTGANTVLYDTICQGSHYVRNGFILMNAQESTTLVQNLATVNGCDSTVTLHLTVTTAYATSLQATICQGSNYTENGFNIVNAQASGIHTLNLESATGCDSIITLNLTVTPTIHINLTDAICQGSDYTANGFNIVNAQAGGIYTLNLETVNGCDSIVTLSLTVNPGYSVTLYDTICQGENYNRHGFSIANAQVSNVYTLNLDAANGCDSTITLNLTVNPAYSVAIYDTVCQGSDYFLHGFALTSVQATAIHTLSHATLTGCDSTVTLYLSVTPVRSTTLMASVCQGNDYMEYGFELTNVQTSGIHTLTLTAANGCDSIVTLHLTVNMPAVTILEDAICQGSDYEENGFNLPNVQTSGVYTLNLATANGCDSTVTLSLTVNPTYDVTITDSIAKGENYTRNGFNLTNVQESGEHTLALTTVNGCDSIITLSLIVTTVGIDDIDANSFDVKLYPNPASEVVTVSVEGLQSDATVEFYDELGRLVMRQSMTAGETELRTNVSHLAAGAYNIRIRTAEGTVIRKLIVR